MEDTLTIVAAYEARAKKLGLPMSAVCARAKMAQSTITRWKAGTFEPTYKALRRLDRAFAELEAAPDAPVSAAA